MKLTTEDFKHWEQAAGQGNLDALLHLGRFFESEKDPVNAFSYFYQAALKNNEEGMQLLCNLLLKLPESPLYARRDFDWLVRSVEVIEKNERDVLRAPFQYLCARIATCYSRGFGVAQDLEMTLHYLEKGIDLGPNRPDDEEAYATNHATMLQKRIEIEEFLVSNS